MTRSTDVLAQMLLLFALAQPKGTVAVAGERYHVDGPVRAELVSVVDGDTMLVNAQPWPQQSISVLVRLRGVDAPELKSRCPRLRHQAQAAKEFLQKGLKGETRLLLTDIDGDKYFGRVVARVAFANQDASELLLASGFARPYGGGHKPAEIC